MCQSWKIWPPKIGIMQHRLWPMMDYHQRIFTHGLRNLSAIPSTDAPLFTSPHLDIPNHEKVKQSVSFYTQSVSTHWLSIKKFTPIINTYILLYHQTQDMIIQFSIFTNQNKALHTGASPVSLSSSIVFGVTGPHFYYVKKTNPHHQDTAQECSAYISRSAH